MRKFWNYLPSLLGLALLVSAILVGAWALGAGGKFASNPDPDRNATLSGKPMWSGDSAQGASLQEALGAFGSAIREFHLPPGIHNVTQNLTVPTNLALRLGNGAVLKVADGVTLTINGPFDAPPAQVFSVSSKGPVKFGQDISTVKPEWWGVTGTADEVAINAAIQAVPLGGTVKLLPKTYTLAHKIDLNRTVVLAGASVMSYTTEPGSTIIDASKIVGTAIEIGGATTDHRLQGHTLQDFWLQCGNGTSVSRVTKGIEVKDYCSSWNLYRIRVSGATAAQDGTGRSYGLFCGGTSSYSGQLNECWFIFNDTGVYLGRYAQGTMFIKGQIFNNYTEGVCIEDTNTITFIGTGIESNGRIAETTCSLHLKGASAVSLIGCYNEQKSNWPGAAMIVEGGASNGLSRNIFIDGGSRFIGNHSSTKGIILKKVEDFSNYGMIKSFTQAGISYEPAMDIGAINNATNFRPDFNPSLQATKLTQSSINSILNPFFDEWDDPSTAVHWHKTAQGSFSQSQDSGMISSYHMKMTGTGVPGEVSITQDMKIPGMTAQAGGLSLLAYVKCPTTNKVISSITVGSRDLSIRNSDSWQWIRLGIVPQSFSAVKVSAKLCKHGGTAMPGDQLQIGYIGVFPGWSLLPGVAGALSNDLRASYTWEVGVLRHDSGKTSPPIAVPGARFGDKVEVGAPLSLRGVGAQGYVDSPDRVCIRLQNNSGSNVNLSHGTWRVVVRK